LGLSTAVWSVAKMAHNSVLMMVYRKVDNSAVMMVKLKVVWTVYGMAEKMVLTMDRKLAALMAYKKADGKVGQLVVPTVHQLERC
jgi:hypothetical protein